MITLEEGLRVRSRESKFQDTRRQEVIIASATSFLIVIKGSYWNEPNDIIHVTITRMLIVDEMVICLFICLP